MRAGRWPILQLPLGPRLGVEDLRAGQDVVVHFPGVGQTKSRIVVRKVKRATGKYCELEGEDVPVTSRSRWCHLHPFDQAAADASDKMDATLEVLKLQRHLQDRVGYWTATELPDIPDAILERMIKLAQLLKADGGVP